MRAGQRVIATHTFGGLFGGAVRQGTKGVIVNVESIVGFFRMYRVKFKGIDGYVSCSPSDIEKI